MCKTMKIYSGGDAVAEAVGSQVTWPNIDENSCSREYALSMHGFMTDR